MALVALPLQAWAGEGPMSVPGPQCTGDYADFLSAMRPENRSFESSPESGYTYCVRNVATYEHLFYGKGGKIRKQYIRHVSHGTAFAYKVKDGEWYIATNQHVAEHPEVTESDRDVQGIPAGARKVREVLKIVKNESDDYEAGHVTLSKVAADESLDLAVLKTRQPLKLMPYRIGKSSALRVGNAVQVRGFPLGVFSAANTGRVISLNQIDRERGWNHEDFAVDALLNNGSSGSPVFAVSCRTGELELVGVYHAGYREAQGLNVVVGIDQGRDFLETLKQRSPVASVAEADAKIERANLLETARAIATPITFPFGDHAVRLEVDKRALSFSVFEAEYPLSTRVSFVLVAREGTYATPSALLLPARFGESELAWARLDSTVKDPAQRLYDALWRQLAAVMSYRETEGRRASPESQSLLGQTATRIRRSKGEQRELLQSLDFESDLIPWPVVGPPLEPLVLPPLATTPPESIPTAEP